MNTSLSRTRNRPWGLLEPDAWKAGPSGSEGAGAQQCAPATRGWRIQRRCWRGRTGKQAVYTYPSVRHEAPCDRVEVKGLHRWAVAAAW
jgi:hypothetical protein